jgi:starch synthase
VIRHEGGRAILIQEYEDPRFDRIVCLGLRMKIPVFASFQGGDRTSSWLEERVRRHSIERSAGLIISSRSERNRVERRYAGWLPPIADIPNPLRAEDWKPLPKAKAREELGIDPEAFLAFNHGRIDIHRKGLDTLVDAWSNFQSLPNEQLVMIGSGQDAEPFARLLEERKPKGLSWHSEYTVDRDQLRRWLSAADVYVTASRIEGMPVAPLEAMSCALPIVATDANGLSDILASGETSGGLLVPKGDAQQFADALRTLRDNGDLRERLGRAAFSRVRNCYSVETVAEQLEVFLARCQ